MPAFTNPFTVNKTTNGVIVASSEPRSAHGKRTTRMHSEGIVSPGRVLSKAERTQRVAEAEHLEARREADRTQRRAQRKQVMRTDSTLSITDGQRDIQDEEDEKFEYDYSFTALRDRVLSAPQSWPGLIGLGCDIDDNFAPGACANILGEFRSARRPNSVRGLIILLILLLLVFGALYNMVEYLLSATRASACDVSTVYVPFTQTVTKTVSNPSGNVLARPASDSFQTMSTIDYTSTSTHTVTSFVTVPADTSTSKLPFVYTVDPYGSTHWINGVSPSSGASIVTATTSVFVTPTYTSTLYSSIKPDQTITSMSTSTHYVTRTVSRVQMAGSISTTRSSFSGMAVGGWNATLSALSPVSPASLTSLDPESTTQTSVYFTPVSEESTSTTTTYTTTTIALHYTTTILPSAEDIGYITTITALSVTISRPGVSASFSSMSSLVNGTLVDPMTASMDSSMVSAPFFTSLPSTYAEMSTVTPPAPSPASPSINTGPSMRVSSSAGPAGNMTSANFVGPASATGFTALSMTANSTVKSLVGTTSAGGVESITHTMSPNPSATASSITPPSDPVSTAPSIATGVASGSPPLPVAGSAFDPQAASTGLLSKMPATITNSSSITTSSTSGSPASVGATNSITSNTTTAVQTGLTTSSASSLIPSSAAPSIGPASATTASNSRHPLAHSSAFTLPFNSSTTSRHVSNSLGSYKTSFVTSKPTTLASSTTAPAQHTSTESKTRTSKAGDPSSTESTHSQRSHRHSQTSKSSKTAMISLSSLTSSVNATSIHPFPATSATVIPAGGCEEHGNFMMGFDDLPNFTPSENDTTITEAPPIFSPYHHLTFSDGYVYAPAPSEPYPPISPPHLAVFTGNASGIGSKGHSGNFVKPGEIGDGPRESISAFWFDAHSAWFGCDNPGPDVCTLVFSAFTWSAATKKEELTFHKNATILPCDHGFADCHLKKIEFPTSFRGLTGIKVQAFVDDEAKMFFMDNLAMRWANNTCAAGLLRQSSR